MLRRLISWCVPDSALKLRADEARAAELRAAEPEVTDLQRVLAPYRNDIVVDNVVGLRLQPDS